jgi:hypothetical protein
MQAALADYKLPEKKRNGDWHCFCSNKKDELSAHDFNLLMFNDPEPSGKGKSYCIGNDCLYCGYWDYLSNFIFLIVLCIPLIMGIVDELITLFFQLTSEFTKPKNETTNLIDLIAGTMWIQFVNLGFILIFVSLKINVGPFPIFGIFDG